MTRPTTYEAYNRYGQLVRTFGTRDQAEAYASRMTAIDCPIRIVRKVEQRRAA